MDSALKPALRIAVVELNLKVASRKYPSLPLSIVQSLKSKL